MSVRITLNNSIVNLNIDHTDAATSAVSVWLLPFCLPAFAMNSIFEFLSAQAEIIE
jgi:hypothetical protein